MEMCVVIVVVSRVYLTNGKKTITAKICQKNRIFIACQIEMVNRTFQYKWLTKTKVGCEQQKQFTSPIVCGHP